jgi:arsenate reductase
VSDFPVTLYHNPNCGTSRNALALLKQSGFEPQVVEYVKAGWTADQLKALFARMGVSPRDVMRVRGTPAEELGLTSPAATDDQIIQAMTEHPILVERPIVATPKGAVLGRPVDKIADLLEPRPVRFTKESGDVVEL